MVPSSMHESRVSFCYWYCLCDDATGLLPSWKNATDWPTDRPTDRPTNNSWCRQAECQTATIVCGQLLISVWEVTKVFNWLKDAPRSREVRSLEWPDIQLTSVIDGLYQSVLGLQASRVHTQVDTHATWPSNLPGGKHSLLLKAVCSSSSSSSNGNGRRNIQLILQLLQLFARLLLYQVPSFR